MIELIERKDCCTHETVYDVYVEHMYGGQLRWRNQQWVMVEIVEGIGWGWELLGELTEIVRELCEDCE